jgi:transcriptional regulator with AAA-type ATPase domain
MTMSEIPIDATLDQSRSGSREAGAGQPVPGLLLIFSGNQARQAPLPLPSGALEVGRGFIAGVALEDARMSRRHARVTQKGEQFFVEDLGSRNGTAADGVELPPGTQAPVREVLRMGASLFLVVPDVRPYSIGSGGVVCGPQLIMGPALAGALATIGLLSRSGGTLHLTGESGAGKEVAARHFHDHGPRPGGPFIAVNCAAIPEGVAERLLFGARKGAYSGAVADTEGYVQAADGGTLFLDEVAELDLSVQAKLLRVLETREVTPLGAARARPVDIRICSATHKDLRAEVAAGRFREDLYFRIGRPVVALPPLRARREEIPWHVQEELRRAGPGVVAHVSLVEACLLRHWPGNVRELRTEIRAAAQVMAAGGEGKKVVELSHLGAEAGMGFGAADDPSSTGGSPSAESAPPPSKERIEEELRRQGGNVSATARALGVHRTQLRRWMARYQIQAAG